MHGYKYIAVWLTTLVIWNAVLGSTGGLVFCLHHVDELHHLDADDHNSCCHIEKEEHQAPVHSCQQCSDVKIIATDLPVIRNDRQQIVPVAGLYATLDSRRSLDAGNGLYMSRLSILAVPEPAVDLSLLNCKATVFRL